MSDEFFDVKEPAQDIELSENLVQSGDNIDLTKLDPTLKRITVGVGWSFNAFDTDPLDLDVSVFLLNTKNETRSDNDFIFYNNPQGLEGAVKHHGDSRDGAGDGDDERISIDLEGIPFDVNKIEFALSIYKASEKDQNLSMLKKTYLRIVNAENHFEMARYILDDELKERSENAMIVATIERDGPKWHFRATGEFIEGGLARIAEQRALVIVDQ